MHEPDKPGCARKAGLMRKVADRSPAWADSVWIAEGERDQAHRDA